MDTIPLPDQTIADAANALDALGVQLQWWLYGWGLGIVMCGLGQLIRFLRGMRALGSDAL